jgi:hypothetical protein
MVFVVRSTGMMRGDDTGFPALCRGNYTFGKAGWDAAAEASLCCVRIGRSLVLSTHGKKITKFFYFHDSGNEWKLDVR